MSKTPLQLAFFSSGNGSSMRAIATEIHKNTLNARIALVISNRANCGAIKWANEQNITTLVINPNAQNSDQTCLNALAKHKIDLIILNGYLKKISAAILNQYPQKIWNTHPSLLPLFGGHGMYGDHIHKAVLATKSSQTGATIHVVDENFDTGRILAQVKIEVHATDTLESLSNRVKSHEQKLLIKTLRAELKNNPIY